MGQEIDFYSHKAGPNPWKTVLVLEELGIPYKTTYLEFGNAKWGVENEEFLSKNAAGRVPLIVDKTNGFALTESNIINQYLVDKYDKDGIFAVDKKLDNYLISKWLGFQSNSQAPFSAQAIQFRTGGNAEAETHFYALVKRTLKTVDTELRGKKYLVGENCTLADISFVPWDLALDYVLEGDPEGNSASLRKVLFPRWFEWHSRLLERPAIQKMIAIQREVNGLSK